MIGFHSSDCHCGRNRRNRFTERWRDVLLVSFHERFKLSLGQWFGYYLLSSSCTGHVIAINNGFCGSSCKFVPVIVSVSSITLCYIKTYNQEFQKQRYYNRKMYIRIYTHVEVVIRKKESVAVTYRTKKCCLVWLMSRETRFKLKYRMVNELLILVNCILLIKLLQL